MASHTTGEAIAAEWVDTVHTAAEASFGSPSAVKGLQSSEQSQLLDAIDEVRHSHVDADINIPQIVVCGDQSSGKSSVLEAIAQIRFPVGNQAVTKFPIEVVLRHAPEPSFKITLHPSHDRSTLQQEHIRKFRPHTPVTDGSKFKDVVQEAKAHLEAIDPNRKFWSDWLSAEVSGPTQPHLTLVDLPGLIHFVDKGNEEDVEKIKRATCDYLKNERAVVLAVVNSANDPANQQILSLVEQTSNAKQRTMGILTKPDEIRKGSEKERTVLGLARNESIHFGLGWHVLRNIGHDERGLDQTRRDEVEQAFFSSGAWSALSRDNIGIGSLRSKLSKGLLTCIKKDLPKLMVEMRVKLTICSKELSELGESRESLGQQREYLAKTLGHLQRVVEAALEGQYRKAEHVTFFNGSEQRQLRDVITTLNKGFAKNLDHNGKQFHIYREAKDRHLRFNDLPREETPLFVQPYMTNQAENRPATIALNRYCRALAKHMNTRRGKNLRNHPSEAVPDIFRQQSVFWEPITRKHVDSCYSSASHFISTAVMHVAGRHTGERIMQHHINPAFDRKSDALDEIVEDLLWPFQQSHPMTYNPSFEKEMSSKPDQDCVDWIVQGEDENAMYSALEAINQADAYYKIAVNLLTDNVATLAVERWLLHDMPHIMPPEIVHTMTDEEVSRIATESEGSKSRRQRLKLQLSALQNALHTCRRHVEHSFVAETSEPHSKANTPNKPTEVLTGNTAQQFSDKRPTSSPFAQPSFFGAKPTSWGAAHPEGGLQSSSGSQFGGDTGGLGWNTAGFSSAIGTSSGRLFGSSGISSESPWPAAARDSAPSKPWSGFK